MLYRCRPVYLSTCLPADQHTYNSLCFYHDFNVPTCLPVHLSTCLPTDHVHVEICIYQTCNVPTYLPVHLSTCPSCSCKSQNMYLQYFSCLHVDQRRFLYIPHTIENSSRKGGDAVTDVSWGVDR